MRLRPDQGSRVEISLTETDDAPRLGDVTVAVFLDYPDIIEVTSDSVVLYTGDGTTQLWHREQMP